MKTYQSLLFIAALAFAQHATAQTRPAPAGTAVTSGETRVIVPTAISELAQGYADAIQQMALKTTVVYVKGDGKVVAIKGIRSARPVGSVLLITLSAGSMLAINPQDVVMITDGASTP
ncbi:hypothetical protein [Oleiharenicola lentus]|uniref:hypothetical protein n=1 Tax=Oleiharenicola lentus TaxID=2508720 RepID=UPI003F671675